MRDYEQIRAPKQLKLRLVLMFPDEKTNIGRLRQLVKTMDLMIYGNSKKK